MRTKEQKESDNRLCAVTLSIFTAFLLTLFTACASVQHDPLYDGDAIPVTDVADSVTLIPITITNSRIRDALDPRFILESNGSHDLGIVRGYGGRVTKFIDKRWVRGDGIVTIIAHYPGGPDLVYEQFLWSKGQRIEVSLDDIFNPVAAWAHR